MKSRYWLAASAVAAGGAVLWMMRQKPAGAPRTLHLDLGEGDRTAEPGPCSVQFIGTATTLIRYHRMTILTDPNFLHRGEHIHIGYGMHATRLTDPAIEFDDLPPVDFVILSHLHEDHFDKQVERRLAKDTPILTTASAARTLKRRGFTRTYPLRTWDSVQIRKGAVAMRLTSTPAKHAPLLVAALLPDVMGSMLEFHDQANGGNYRMYISGDTLIHGDLREIPLRFPKVDLALLHLGGTRVMGVLMTMDAKQGIEALRIVRPDLAIPIHYNDYDIFKEPLEIFKRAVERAGVQDKVRYLQRGDRYSFAPRDVKEPQPVT